MGTEYSILKIVSPEVVKQFQDVTAFAKEFEACIVRINEASRGLQGGSGMKDYQVAMKKITTETQAAEAAIKKKADEEQKAWAAAEKAAAKGLAKKEAAEQKELEAAMKKLNAEKQKKIDLDAKEAAKAKELEDAYKKLQKTVKDLEAQYKSVAASQGINSKAAKDLKVELDKQSGSLKSINKEAGNFKDNVGNYPLLEKVKGAWMGVTAALGAVGISMAGIIKFGKDLINSSDELQDKWEEMTTGMSFAYGQFMQSLTLEGFSNFFEKFDKAYKKGVEYAQLLDEIAEKQLGYDIANAKDEERLKKLLILSKSRFNTEAQRIDYGNQYLALANKIAYREVDIAKDVIESNTIIAEQKSKLGYATVAKYLEERPYKKKEIEEAKEYNEQLRISEMASEKARHGGGVTPAGFDKAREYVKNASSELKAFASIVAGVDKLSGEEQAKITEGIVGISKARQSYDDKTMKTQVLISSLATKNGDMEVAAAKKEEVLAGKTADEKAKIDADLWAYREKYGLLSYNVLAKHEQDALKKEKFYALLSEEEKQKALSEIDKKWREKRLKDMEQTFDRMKYGKGMPVVTGAGASAMGVSPASPGASMIDMIGGEDALKTQLNNYNDFLKEQNKQYEQSIKEKEDADEKHKQAAISAARELFGQLQSIGNMYFQSQIGNLQIESDTDSIEKEKQLEAAKGNKREINRINKEFDTKEKERAKEARRIVHDQAVYNQLTGVVNVGINTAVGATKAFADPGGPAGIVLAALIIAAGLLEEAVILGQKIPSYKTGRKGGKEELAQVHKGEIIEMGSSASYVADDTLARLPLGASVLTADEVRRDYMNKSMSRLPLNYRHDSTLDTLPIVNGLNGIRSDLKNQKQLIVNIDKHGFRTSLRSGQTHENWINNRVRL